MTEQAQEDNVTILVNPMPTVAVAAVEVRATVVSNGGTGTVNAAYCNHWLI